jgi:hypothetical protein
MAHNRSKSYKVGTAGQMSNLFIKDLQEIEQFYAYIKSSMQLSTYVGCT